MYIKSTENFMQLPARLLANPEFVKGSQKKMRLLIAAFRDVSYGEVPTGATLQPFGYALASLFHPRSIWDKLRADLMSCRRLNFSAHQAPHGTIFLEIIGERAENHRETWRLKIGLVPSNSLTTSIEWTDGGKTLFSVSVNTCLWCGQEIQHPHGHRQPDYERKQHLWHCPYDQAEYLSGRTDWEAGFNDAYNGRDQEPVRSSVYNLGYDRGGVQYQEDLAAKKITPFMRK